MNYWIRGLLPAFIAGLTSLASAQVTGPAVMAAPSQSNESCEQVLSGTLAGSAADLTRQSELRRGNSRQKQPRFVTPKEEQEIAKKWIIEKGPALFQSYLPEHAGFVDHELRNNEAPGIVKIMQEGGQFLTLRVEIPWNGKMIGMNVTVSAFSLVDNMKRFLAGERVYLIGPSVASAIDWGHGGGTKSSTSSTVEIPMNSLAKSNIASIAMDQPQHGEGYRGWFKNVDDYLRFRVAFVKRFVDPSVPVWLVGHSMGGEIADMAARRMGRPDIGLEDVYAGVIALSFVPDAKPGGTFEEKQRAEMEIARKQNEPPLVDLINPGDRDLGRTLMQQGKSSLSCELQCLFFALENNWSLMPPPNVISKRSGRPMKYVYITGEHDALTRGYEKIFENHLMNMPNMQLITFDVRVTRTGDVIPVGHMIFDHFPPVENSPEANALIRDWLVHKDQAMSGKSDADLKEIFKNELVAPKALPFTFLTKENGYPSALVLAAYYYSPEFKAFVDERVAKTVSGEVGVDEDGDPTTHEMALDKARRNYLKQFGEFDSKREPLETIELIRNIILEPLGKTAEMKTVANTPESKALKFYANTLLFREYLRKLVYGEAEANGSFKQLAMSLKDFTKNLSKIRSDKRKSPEEKLAQTAQLETPAGADGRPMSVEEAVRWSDLLNKIQNREYVPDGANAELAKRNIDRRAAIVTELAAVHATMEKVKKDVDGLLKQMRRWDFKLHSALAAPAPEEVSAMDERLLQEEDQLNEDRERVSWILNQQIGEGSASGLDFNDVMDGISQEIWDMFVFWNDQSERYQANKSEVEKARVRAALAGHYGTVARKYAELLYGPGNVFTKLETEKQILERAAFQLRKLSAEQNQLVREYVENVIPDWFRWKEVNVWDELNRLDQLNEASYANRDERDQTIQAYIKGTNSLLEKALNQFKLEVWGHRPPPGKTELY